MLQSHAIVREAANRVADAALRTVNDLISGRVEDEPPFTGIMIGRIAEAMDGFRQKGLVWNAKVLTANGRNSQEKQYGADFLVSLEITLPGEIARKGFLVQAKRIEPGHAMNRADHDRMVGQCKRMGGFSPDSFAWLYSSQGIAIVPAIAERQQRPRQESVHVNTHGRARDFP
jgi:hypothetical protein